MFGVLGGRLCLEIAVIAVVRLGLPDRFGKRMVSGRFDQKGGQHKARCQQGATSGAKRLELENSQSFPPYS